MIHLGWTLDKQNSAHPGEANNPSIQSIDDGNPPECHLLGLITQADETMVWVLPDGLLQAALKLDRGAVEISAQLEVLPNKLFNHPGMSARLLSVYSLN